VRLTNSRGGLQKKSAVASGENEPTDREKHTPRPVNCTVKNATLFQSLLETFN
jgi:hypothetical protein